ncbi:site-specific integrase [Rathayibacter sp. VKM Ac-2835]|uniref:site-specific integrase n=1 Tax=Rathayibacter sp. VKM Ac-2835 TaxID=2739043 RepID=UPI001567435D|nr:site-specific integrase [Rathayibacter sp. VKM Ac-2835]NRG40203.1 site-specific integrase [Rathayibacter sp. VKM Ac-2835]
MKLSSLAQRFLEVKRLEGVAQRTTDTYSWAVATVIAPTAGNDRGVGELTIREATPERLDRFLGGVVTSRGNGAAKTTKSVLSGMMTLAVRNGAARTNPVRDVGKITRANEGAVQIPLDAMALLLERVRADKELGVRDLRDLIEFLAGTGVRISEALGLQWASVDLDAGTIAIVSNVVRIKGQGIVRQSHTKTEAGRRVIVVPQFVITMLRRRQSMAMRNEFDAVFPSMLLKLRDPSNTLKDWREHRDRLGAPGTSFHSFRKYVATALDEAGLSAREIADYLGHSRPSMTQDVYMGRKATGTRAASALDRTIE